jgi:hypothetical protein
MHFIAKANFFPDVSSFGKDAFCNERIRADVGPSVVT